MLDQHPEDDKQGHSVEGMNEEEMRYLALCRGLLGPFTWFHGVAHELPRLSAWRCHTSLIYRRP